MTSGGQRRELSLSVALSIGAPLPRGESGRVGRSSERDRECGGGARAPGRRTPPRARSDAPRVRRAPPKYAPPARAAVHLPVVGLPRSRR
eukprot:scaffold6655_cov188-Prasinococcus_capsulatus_cf.AAC.1